MDEERIEVAEEKDEDILDLALQNEYENSCKFELGSAELTKSNSVIASLYKAKADILKSQDDKELRLAEIEAEERKDKRLTRQKYVQTGLMCGIAGLALLADSDTFVGRTCKNAFGLATKLIFK